jgi:ATP-binding cassette subfamily F protein 3
MGMRLKAIHDQLEADEMRWLELGEQIEAMGT